jgi:hypothetical protein
MATRIARVALLRGITMMTLRKSATVVAYTYEAGEHCLDCAAGRFGLGEIHAFDSEGNAVYPVFLDQTAGDSFTCDTCFQAVNY